MNDSGTKRAVEAGGACACGCGAPARSGRSWGKYATDRCRMSAWLNVRAGTLRWIEERIGLTDERLARLERAVFGGDKGDR